MDGNDMCCSLRLKAIPKWSEKLVLHRPDRRASSEKLQSIPSSLTVFLAVAVHPLVESPSKLLIVMMTEGVGYLPPGGSDRYSSGWGDKASSWLDTLKQASSNWRIARQVP